MFWKIRANDPISFFSVKTQQKETIWINQAKLLKIPLEFWSFYSQHFY